MTERRPPVLVGLGPDSTPPQRPALTTEQFLVEFDQKVDTLIKEQHGALARIATLESGVGALVDGGHRTLDAVAALRERVDESIDQDARILVKLAEISTDNAAIKGRLGIVEREGSSPAIERRLADLAFEDMNTGLKMRTLALMEEERRLKAKARQEEEAHALAAANRKRFWDLFWKAAALLVMTLVGYFIAKLTGR